jgi:hypothetical protein
MIISFVACFVLLAIEKLCSYRRAPVRGGFGLGVCVWGAYALLAFFIAAFLSLLRRDAPRIVPLLLLAVVVRFGWLEMMIALMWLPFVATEIIRRLLSL